MDKKYDPRMHTAEHILNQTMVRMFGCGRCFNAHIEKKKSKCDYRVERSPSKEEVFEIAALINEVISADLPVTEEYMDRYEAKKRFNLSRLPEDAGDKLRIVNVGDYDACPCIGPHVPSTAQIGAFHIVSTSIENNILRIRFKLDSPKIYASVPGKNM